MNTGQHSSDSGEWWTPDHIVAPARGLFGGFDLDPASCLAANAVVQARRIITAGDDGLMASWEATTVWCNPPSKKGVARVADWWEMAVREWYNGRVGRLWFMVFNPSSFFTTAGGRSLRRKLPPPQDAIRVEFRKRVKYDRPMPMFPNLREPGRAPPHGSALLLLTSNRADAVVVAAAYKHLGETMVPARWLS